MKKAILTIDDVPSDNFRHKVLFLKKNNIPAIFFIIGKVAERKIDDLVYAIKKGFIIGNHSYTHPSFSEISLEEAEKQIKKTNEIIEKAYKKAKIQRQIKFFRFPMLDNGGGFEYGETKWNDKKVRGIRNILKKLDYQNLSKIKPNYRWFNKAGYNKCINIDCSYDSYDWTVADKSYEHGINSLKEILKRMDEHVPEGCRGLNYKKSDEIIMMHDDSRIKSMFKPMIRKLQTKVKFVYPINLKVQIKKIPKKDLKIFHKLKKQYGSGDEKFSKTKEIFENNPDLCVGCYLDNELIGETTGVKKGEYVNLDHICIKYECWGAGLGSKLLKFLEKQIKKGGIKILDVEVADNPKTELFYLKNDFKPYRIKAKGKNHFLYEELNVKNYEDGLKKKEILREKHNPKEVNFIMKKTIK
jgi:peptidoglycan-N-acetylglucosamine deacetylase